MLRVVATRARYCESVVLYYIKKGVHPLDETVDNASREREAFAVLPQAVGDGPGQSQVSAGADRWPDDEQDMHALLVSNALAMGMEITSVHRENAHLGSVKHSTSTRCDGGSDGSASCSKAIVQ
jgi:hypothetical protein